MFPAEALAAELEARGRRLVLMTDRSGAAFGDVLGRIERHAIAARSPSVRGPLARGLAILGPAYAVMQLARVLRRIRPSAAVGFGVYPSVPPLVASGRLGIPSVLHEQNAVLGHANWMLARWASTIATSFPETERVPRNCAGLVTCVGNPVRAAIEALHGIRYIPPVSFRLLVTGGSHNARVFANVVPEAIAALTQALRRRLPVSQQCRPEDLAGVQRRYADAGVKVKLAPFEDLPARLSEAHLVICRAGASTIAELAVTGRAAILVPLPIAADDHQSVNGRAFVAAGAATMIGQESSPQRLAGELAALMADPAQLSEQAVAARRFARPDSAPALADLVEGLIGARQPLSLVAGNAGGAA